LDNNSNNEKDELKVEDYVACEYDHEVMRARITKLNKDTAEILVSVSSKRGENPLQDVLEVPKSSLKKIKVKLGKEELDQ
jgi:hypothetical protein